MNKKKRSMRARLHVFVRHLLVGHEWQFIGSTIRTVDKRGPLRFEFEKCDGCGEKRCVVAPAERQPKIPNEKVRV